MVDQGQREQFQTFMGTSPLDLLHKPYEYVARGISTAAQVEANANAAGFAANDESFGTYANGMIHGKWGQAWDRSKTVTAGQAIAIDLSGRQALEKFGQDPFSPAAAPARQDYFHDTWAGRLTSGSIDFALNWTADPLVIGGKATRAFRQGAHDISPSAVPTAMALAAGDKVAGKVTLAEKNTAGWVARMSSDQSRLGYHELMTQPELKNLPARGMIADLLTKANEIEDPVARAATKRDVLGTLIGDSASMTRIQNRMDGLSTRIERISRPPEGGLADEAFAWGDHGQGEINFWNSEANLKELDALAKPDQAELDRLSALWNTGKITSTYVAPGAQLAATMAAHDVRESVLRDGVNGRPVRVIWGAIGAGLPNHVDTVDAAVGYDTLSKVLQRSRYLTADDKASLLWQFGTAPDRATRVAIVAHATNMLYKRAGDANGLGVDEIKAFHDTTTGVMNRWNLHLKSRLYSGNSNLVGRDGQAIQYSPLIAPHIADSVPIPDPEMIQYGITRQTQTRWLEAITKRSGGDVASATKVMNLQDSSLQFADAVARGLMMGWKLLALGRLAYIPRIQVDTQGRMLASLKPLAYGLSVEKGMVNAAKNMVPVKGEAAVGVLRSAATQRVAIRKELATLAGKTDATSLARTKELTRRHDQILADLQSNLPMTRRGKTAERATPARRQGVLRR